MGGGANDRTRRHRLETSTTSGSTSARCTRPLYLLNLFRAVSLISLGHGCAETQSWRLVRVT